MRLLNADVAITEPALLQYLLDESHPENNGKARVFYALGYALDDWQRLEADIRSQLLILDAIPGRPSPHGETYEVIGYLQGPTGRANMRTIWMYERGGQVPRLITAYPV